MQTNANPSLSWTLSYHAISYTYSAPRGQDGTFEAAIQRFLAQVIVVMWDSIAVGREETGFRRDGIAFMRVAPALYWFECSLTWDEIALIWDAIAINWEEIVVIWESALFAGLPMTIMGSNGILVVRLGNGCMARSQFSRFAISLCRDASGSLLHARHNQ